MQLGFQTTENCRSKKTQRKFCHKFTIIIKNAIQEQFRRENTKKLIFAQSLFVDCNEIKNIEFTARVSVL